MPCGFAWLEGGYQPRNSVFSEQLQIIKRLLLVIVRIAKEQGIAMLLSDIFNAPDKLGKERVRNAWNQEANGKAPLSAQAAGQKVGMVIKFGDCLAQADSGGLSDTRFIVDHGRDRLDRDVRKLSDINHGDPGRRWRWEVHGFKTVVEPSCERSSIAIPGRCQ